MLDSVLGGDQHRYCADDAAGRLHGFKQLDRACVVGFFNWGAAVNEKVGSCLCDVYVVLYSQHQCGNSHLLPNLVERCSGNSKCARYRLHVQKHIHG